MKVAEALVPVVSHPLVEMGGNCRRRRRDDLEVTLRADRGRHRALPEILRRPRHLNHPLLRSHHRFIRGIMVDRL